MGERRGTKGLELWCRRMTEGYPGVKIENMTTSWRNGLAFCAMIHHFRPELIDFTKLNKDDIHYNNNLAFTVAEKYLGIPALLEPEDMVEYAVPDRLSILTYLSQFYRTFVSSQESSSRIVPKRPTNPSERGLISRESTSPPTKMAIKTSGMPRRDPCAKCGLPVFIAERLNVGKLLYHRTCFRCARCNSQLTLANYYETETKNQFCCETCPDEEILKEPDKPYDNSVVSRSLSDEEKSAGLKEFDEEDDYSTMFEAVLENSNLSKNSSLNSVRNSEFLTARSHFISSQIEYSGSYEEVPPELPKTMPPNIASEQSQTGVLMRNENVTSKDIIKTIIVNNASSESTDSTVRFNTHSFDSNVINSDNTYLKNQLSATNELDESNAFVTKENQSTNEDSPSTVRSRKCLFEKDTNFKKNYGATKIRSSPVDRIQASGIVTIAAGRIDDETTPNDIVSTSPYKKHLSEMSPTTSTPKKQTSAIKDRTPISTSNTKESFLLKKKTSISDQIQKQTSPEKNNCTAHDETSKDLFCLTNPMSKQIKSSPLSTTVKAETKSSEKSLNLLLQKHICAKASNNDRKPVVNTFKLSSTNIPVLPGKLLKSNGKSNTSQRLLEENRSYSKPPVHTNVNNISTGESTILDHDVALQGKKTAGVSSLKNMFDSSVYVEHLSVDSNIDSSDNFKIETHQTIEKLVFDTGIPNFSETVAGSIDEPLSGEEESEQEPLTSKDHACENELAKNVFKTPCMDSEQMPYVTNEPLQVKADSVLNIQDVNVQNEPLLDEDSVSARSNSSNKFVALTNISSEIMKSKHSSDTFSTKEDNISLSDNQRSIIINDTGATKNIRTEDSVIEITDYITNSSDVKREHFTKEMPNSIIEISDSIIEISDSVIELSDSSSSESCLITKPMNEIKSEFIVKTKSENDYPEDLNPFSDDDSHDGIHNDVVKAQENSDAKVSEKSLNPFEDDEAEDEHKVSMTVPTPFSSNVTSTLQGSLNPFELDEMLEETDNIQKSPTPLKRTKIMAMETFLSSPHTDTPEFLRKVYIEEISGNQIETGKNQVELCTFAPEIVVEQEPRKLKLISAPRISLNPFWSDDNEDELNDEEESKKPVPMPRKFKNGEAAPDPKPRASNHSLFGSNTSISSANSGAQSGKKKKLAPKPPAIVCDKAESTQSSLTSSPSTSVQHSPKCTPKIKKHRKAPLPPTFSTPILELNTAVLSSSINVSPIIKSESRETKSILRNEVDETNIKVITNSDGWDREKEVKDEVNRNRQSQCLNIPGDSVTTESAHSIYPVNKSTYGKWKRKKGPAPSRPVPQRRIIKTLPVTEVRRELDLIELQHQGLEKQGVRLEQIIRDRCEGPNASDEDIVPIDVEDLILQLFEVVNEKNELCRRQAELMYLQRQQRLEEEHAEVEYQIRCLMLQPEANKTDTDKTREEALINRLVEVVERRNEIVECLEMDRVREAEEDDSISTSMNTYVSKRDEIKVKLKPEVNKKVKKRTKKAKRNKSKNAEQIDVDKDVDECESSNALSNKEKKKKKFTIF